MGLTRIAGTFNAFCGNSMYNKLIKYAFIIASIKNNVNHSAFLLCTISPALSLAA